MWREDKIISFRLFPFKLQEPLPVLLATLRFNVSKANFVDCGWKERRLCIDISYM